VVVRIEDVHAGVRTLTAAH